MAYTRTISFRSDDLTDKEIREIQKHLNEELSRKRFTDTDVIKTSIDFLHAELQNKSNK